MFIHNSLQDVLGHLEVTLFVLAVASLIFGFCLHLPIRWAAQDPNASNSHAQEVTPSEVADMRQWQRIFMIFAGVCTYLSCCMIALGTLVSLRDWYERTSAAGRLITDPEEQMVAAAYLIANPQTIAALLSISVLTLWIVPLCRMLERQYEERYYRRQAAHANLQDID